MTNNNLALGFSVDDVGLEGYSSPEHLENLLEFFSEQQIKATFFVVPEIEGTAGIGSNKDYLRLLTSALRNGHEIAQHGIRHERFEIGIPPQMVLNLPHEGPAREFLRNHRELLEREHSVKNIRRKLRYGREILEDSFGVEIKGFRAPALQSCSEMFTALAEEDYPYDSSFALQETGWDYIEGRLDSVPRKITKERFSLSQQPGLKVLPLTTDYAWYLDGRRYAATLDLAQLDFVQCRESGIPLIPVCHVSPVQEDDGSGFRLLREWIGSMRETAERENFSLTSMTLGEIAELIPAETAC